MQEIRIEGYVGQDPVTKNSNGKDYTYFSVGCSSKTNRKDANGNDIYATTWYTVYCTPAEASGIFKGTRVLVTGMPKYSTYMDRAGQVQIQININFAKIYISTYVSEKQAQPDSKDKATTNQKQQAQPNLQGQSQTTQQTITTQQQTAQIDNTELTQEDNDLPF